MLIPGAEQGSLWLVADRKGRDWDAECSGAHDINDEVRSGGGLTKKRNGYLKWWRHNTKDSDTKHDDTWQKTLHNKTPRDDNGATHFA